jgi:hypothetical protein
MNERLRFSTHQAAEFAGYNVQTVRKALAAGDLHGTQRLRKGEPVKGGKWSIRRECLEAWLDGERCEHMKGAAA